MRTNPKYLDPKDEYVRSQEPVSIRVLAERWHKQQRDGYSESWLRKRSAIEKWGDQRLEYWERLRNATVSKELEKTADEYAAVVDRYTRLLEGVMAGAVRFLRQYDPDQAPPYKGPKEAADVIMTAIAADRKVRGLDSINMTIADVSPGWMKLFDKLGIRKPGNGHEIESSGSAHAPEELN